MNTERMTDEEVAGWHEEMRFASPPADASPVDRVLQDHLRARREERMKDDRIHALEVQQADLLRQLAELREMHSQMSRLNVERQETIKALADEVMLEGSFLGQEWHQWDCMARNVSPGVCSVVCTRRRDALRLVGRIK